MKYPFITSIACGVVTFVATSASGVYVSYNASLGTLPQAQGWSYTSTDSTVPSVSGGQLHHGPTGESATSYWRQLIDTTANFTTQTWSITSDLNVIDSTYNPGGGGGGVWRGGFGQLMSDAAGRWAILEISSDRIRLRNENIGSASPTYMFNTESGFHLYELRVGPTGAKAFLDGTLILTNTLGTGFNPREVFFADGTGYGHYQGDIRTVKVSPVPEPGTLALTLFLGAGILAKRRRL